MRQLRKRQGFTLVELLVVISIIVVLAAILYPVFQSVRENARQANCIANLNQLSTALKQYRTDHGRYPFAPYYDGTRYHGGFSALAPDYITDKSVLICPADRQVDGMVQEAKDKGYSSYNGYVADPLTSWDFEDVTATSPDGNTSVNGKKRTYNYHGYSHEGWDCFYWNSASDTNMPYASTLPSWLRNEGLSWRHYPRLGNRQAPDNTYATHCVHHRDHYKKDTDKIDIIMTIGGTAKKVNVSQMSQPGADAAHPAKFVSQND